ncbi:MAG TPA: hypothetical protein VM554_07100 [Acidisarcina sp.]|nr:hypothetical protein [Acidisarcina sp.]
MKSRWIIRISAGFVAVMFLLFMGWRFTSAQTTDSAAVSQLLADARTQARLAEDDAAMLESFTTSGVSWQTHSSQLNSMKEHVNDLGKTVKQLNDIRGEGSPWQQEAIDRINPLLRHMADQLTTTINHLNNNQSRVGLPPYRDYTTANHELASRTAATINDFVEYGKAKAKAQSLEQKLELPSSGTGE